MLLKAFFFLNYTILGLVHKKTFIELVTVSPNTGPSAGTKLIMPAGSPASRLSTFPKYAWNTVPNSKIHIQ
jgi:hypothetical protein